MDVATLETQCWLDGRTQEETNFRWAYALLLELAKIELEIANAEAKPGHWPAQQEWDDLGDSSRSTFLHLARDRVGIPHDKFLENIRNGKYDVDDIFFRPSNDVS